MTRAIVLLTGALVLWTAPQVSAQKVRDVARVEGVRQEHLKGIGLVMGLSGTGDSAQSQVTRRMYAGLLEHLGLEIPEAELRSKNVAVVMVDATISSWTAVGSEIEVTVSSIGDAKSLKGGRLLETTLHESLERPGKGKDIIAVAQGQLTALGETPTVARASGTLEKDISYPLLKAELQTFRIVLNRPDFSTAPAIARAINEYPYLRVVARDDLPIAHADDMGSVTVKVPLRFRAPGKVVEFISRVMSDIPIEQPDLEAAVVIDKASSAIAVNGKVRVAPVVLQLGKLEIEILDKKDPTGAPRPNRLMDTTNQGYPLLINVMDDLRKEGIADADLPRVIRMIHDAGALLGKLVEK
ncbi:MAG: flagellar basal body P-ring protein FlgI [Planctomycetota bacterium]